MSLIVEDGTGLSTAEAYISVADAGTYLGNRGDTSWAAATTAAKEAALRAATDYMIQTFRPLWQGYRMTQAQALDWPRAGVVVDGFEVATDVVPTEVARACAEYALRVLAGDELLPDRASGGQVVRERVDVIETEYLPGSSPAPSFPAVDRMISPFLSYLSGGANRRVLRA